MSLVDNTPTPCNLPAGPPAGAALVTIRWYLNWPIIYDLGPAPAAGFDIYVNQVQNNGGKIVGVNFMDSGGKPLPGLDACGNPLAPPPPPGGGGDGDGGDDGTLIVPPPPNFPPPPAYGAPQDDGDELTADLCAQMRADTKRVVYTLNELLYYASKLGGGTESCCAAIESALGSIASILGAIEKTLAQVHTVVDLTPLVDAVTTLKASLDALPPAMSDDTGKLVAALDGIKDTLLGPPTTFRPLPPDVDVDALIQYEVDNFALDSGAAQLLTAPSLKTP